MGFEDIFEHRKGYRKYDSHHNDHYNEHDEHGYQQQYRGGYGHGHPAFNIIGKIWNNPKLRLFAILAVIIILALVVLVLIAIIPFIFKLLDSIAQTGLKGAAESVTGFLEKLWSGSGS
jgi:hypothetical protein